MSEAHSKTSRRYMGRGMWVVGWVAVPLWLGAGLAGYLERNRPGLPAAHVGMALLATLMLLFAHSWVVLYALGVSRLSEDTVSQESFDLTLARLPDRWLKAAGPSILAVSVLAVVVFAAGVGGFTSHLPIAVHVSGGALVVVIQVVALGRERRLLRRIEWLIQALGEVR